MFLNLETFLVLNKVMKWFLSAIRLLFLDIVIWLVNDIFVMICLS